MAVTPQTPYAQLPQWMTVSEVAVYLRLTEDTIYSYVKDGTLKSRRCCTTANWIAPARIEIPRTEFHPSRATCRGDGKTGALREDRPISRYLKGLIGTYGG